MRIILVIAFLFMIDLTNSSHHPEAGTNLIENKEALDIIADFANRICKDIPLTGSEENIDLSGSAKAELSKVISKIVSLGVEGAAKYQKSEFGGLLHKDLAIALRDSRVCRLEIWRDLKIEFLSGESEEERRQLAKAKAEADKAKAEADKAKAEADKSKDKADKAKAEEKQLAADKAAKKAANAEIKRRQQYELVKGNFTWNQAKDDAIRRGGFLATITSSQEWHVIKQQLGNGNLCGEECWIGLTDLYNEGHWQWINGEADTGYRYWCSGEPNDTNGIEDYVMLDGNCERCPDSRWNDAPGSAVLPCYLLERKNQ